LRVVEIAVHGAGGHCTYAPAGSDRERAVIAWGGVLAQGVLLAATVIARDALGAGRFALLEEVSVVFVLVNVLMIGVNLLPVQPLDGADAWRLVPMLLRHLEQRVDAHARAERARAQPKNERELSRENQAKVIQLIDRATKRKER
jgi:hypothetical protein